MMEEVRCPWRRSEGFQKHLGPQSISWATAEALFAAVLLKRFAVTSSVPRSVLLPLPGVPHSLLYSLTLFILQNSAEVSPPLKGLPFPSHSLCGSAVLFLCSYNFLGNIVTTAQQQLIFIRCLLYIRHCSIRL